MLPADVDVVSVYPHAHYLAKRMTGTADLPDGSRQTAVVDSAWDIRWQDQYRYADAAGAAGRHDAADAFHLRQLRSQHEQSGAAAAARAMGSEITDEMAALWLEVIPRRAEESHVSSRSCGARASRRHRRGGSAGAGAARTRRGHTTTSPRSTSRPGACRTAIDELRRAAADRA